ncbi:hypothetical protein [Endozoicomonas sp. ALB060]
MSSGMFYVSYLAGESSFKWFKWKTDGAESQIVEGSFHDIYYSRSCKCYRLLAKTKHGTINFGTSMSKSSVKVLKNSQIHSLVIGYYHKGFDEYQTEFIADKFSGELFYETEVYKGNTLNFFVLFIAFVSFIGGLYPLVIIFKLFTSKEAST